ncbi:hypothetical protein ACP4OV_030717 [Aristida adscensionis]
MHLFAFMFKSKLRQGCNNSCHLANRFGDSTATFIQMLPSSPLVDIMKYNYSRKTPKQILELLPKGFIHGEDMKISEDHGIVIDTGLSYQHDSRNDAELAGGEHSHECTLIVIEGESAALLFVEIIEETLGCRIYGLFSITGKPNNIGKKDFKERVEILNLF